jgi:hypothetical protein
MRRRERGKERDERIGKDAVTDLSGFLCSSKISQTLSTVLSGVSFFFGD